MNNEDLTKAVEVVRSKVGDLDAFGSTICIDFKNGSSIFIDGNASPPTVAENSDADADCTVSAEPDVFKELVDGDLDPTAAFMTGKISVDGNMSAALSLQKILG